MTSPYVWGGYNGLGFLRKPKACYRVSVCSHCSHFCFAKSTKTRTIFPPRPCKSTTDKLSAFKKHKSNRQNKVISTGGNEHILVTEPVEVTGNAFCAANSFPTFKKYKFSEQENISCKFYEVKLGKQGFALRRKTLEQARKYLLRVFAVFANASASFLRKLGKQRVALRQNASGASKQKLVSKPQGLRHKLLSETSDGLPATDKVLSEASDGLPATDKVLSEASDGLPAIDKLLSEVSDGLPATDRTLSEASDGLPATDKVLSEPSDGFTASDRTLSEASDTFTASNRALSEPSDSLTATDRALSKGSDGFAQVGKYVFGAKDNIVREFYKRHLRVCLLA